MPLATHARSTHARATHAHATHAANSHATHAHATQAQATHGAHHEVDADAVLRRLHHKHVACVHEDRVAAQLRRKACVRA
eukprot:176344-Chlamydomonas_euryale.AAC.2